MNEPKESFPYKPPSDELKNKFQHIFSLTTPLPERILKKNFDKILAIFLLIILSPIILFLKIAYAIEGFLIPENKGKMFFYYNAISKGKVFPKYKIRIIKEKHIDKELDKNHDWKAYSAEWTPTCRTYVGHFVKKYYLDEIPQLYNILKGDMSFVGPRPLCVAHYERDLKQGNVSRFLIKGGLLGFGHIRKGQHDMGDPAYEYEYIERYLKDNPLIFFIFDIYILCKGTNVLLKGKGL